MKAIFAVVAETAALVTVVGVIQFLVLFFRSPHRPRWLRTELMEIVTANSFVLALTFGIAAELSGLVAGGANAFLAIALTAAIVLGSAFAIWRIFGVGERLRRADAGESPFYPMRWHATRPPAAPQLRP